MYLNGFESGSKMLFSYIQKQITPYGGLPYKYMKTGNILVIKSAV